MSNFDNIVLDLYWAQPLTPDDIERAVREVAKRTWLEGYTASASHTTWRGSENPYND